MNPSRWWCDVLRCADGNSDDGSTGDLRRRIRAHHAGTVRATAWRRPGRLIDRKRHTTAAEARAREQQCNAGWMSQTTLALLLSQFGGKPGLAPVQPPCQGLKL